MPGIAGIFNPAAPVEPDLVRRMAQALAFDPRDVATFEDDTGWCMGVVDRGIFPAAGGIMRSGDTSRAACFQGQIIGLNGESPAPDAAAAARACWVDAIDADRLRCAAGTFAAAVVDRDRGSLELISDPAGTYPLYFAKAGDAWIFATRQSAILASGLLQPRMDRVAVGQMLQLGFICGERTLIEGIYVLPPGTILRIDDSGTTRIRYASMEFQPDADAVRRDAIQQVGAALTQAVHRAAAAHPRLGVPVSGGLDSRALLALCPDHAGTPSFTFGTPGCRDLVFGRQIAQRLGSPHTALEVDPAYLADYLDLGVWLTEGQLGATHFHILPHVTAFARECDVVLDGLGGDVILGGKYVKDAWLNADDPSTAARAIWTWLVGAHDRYSSTDGLAPLDPEVLEQSRREVLDLYRHSPGARPADKAMAFLLENRTRRFIGCGPQLLRWRVECHQPFFDVDLVSAIAALPHLWRKRSRLLVDVIRRFAPRAASARWQHTNLPVSAPYWVSWTSMLVHRAMETGCRKLGLPSPFPRRESSHFADWLRGPLRPLVESVLLSDRSLDRGTVAADFVRNIVSQHLDGRADRSHAIGVLLALESFSRQCLDDLDAALQRYAAGARPTSRPMPKTLAH